MKTFLLPFFICLLMCSCEDEFNHNPDSIIGEYIGDFKYHVRSDTLSKFIYIDTTDVTYATVSDSSNYYKIEIKNIYPCEFYIKKNGNTPVHFHDYGDTTIHIGKYPETQELLFYTKIIKDNFSQFYVSFNGFKI